MNDTELFNLCKEVYKRTGLDSNGDELKYIGYRPENKDEFIIELIWTEQYREHFIGYGDDSIQIAPLYTTDYLLEKLPDALNSPSFNIAYRLQLEKINDWYSCEYSNHGWFQSMKSVFTRKGYDTSDNSLAYGLEPTTADTPLKALLKLTIALDDTGELPHE